MENFGGGGSAGSKVKGKSHGGILGSVHQMAMEAQPGHSPLSTAHQHIPGVRVAQGNPTVAPVPCRPSKQNLSLADAIALKSQPQPTGISSSPSLTTLTIPSLPSVSTPTSVSLNTSFASVGTLWNIRSALADPSM